jgi:hypothetical protein
LVTFTAGSAHLDPIRAAYWGGGDFLGINPVAGGCEWHKRKRSVISSQGKVGYPNSFSSYQGLGVNFTSKWGLAA